jgi:hypothetical protein
MVCTKPFGLITISQLRIKDMREQVAHSLQQLMETSFGLLLLKKLMPRLMDPT